jgi:(2Fe-2S) ferredoxin
MHKLTSIHDLHHLREQARQDLKLRISTGTAITVGVGTCGIAAGAKETMAAIEQELKRRGIEAWVSGVGCVGMCAREPLVDIQQAGASHVLYGNIMPEMVPRLIEQHLLKGQPVKEWVICRMPNDER